MTTDTETGNSSSCSGGASDVRGGGGRTELLPCPFCAAPGFLVGGVTAYEVKCTNTDCTARGREHPNRREATAAWNRRAPSAPADKAEAVPAGPYCFVQSVPDHCDRITWRNHYYSLPLARSAHALLREAMEALTRAQAWITEEMIDKGWGGRVDDPPEGSHLHAIDAALAKLREQLGTIKEDKHAD